MPPVNFGGNPPDSIMEVVTAGTNGNIAPSGPTHESYTLTPLVMGSADTIRNEPGVGYPF
jgi:hypothetical protein